MKLRSKNLTSLHFHSNCFVDDAVLLDIALLYKARWAEIYMSVLIDLWKIFGNIIYSNVRN